jgi:hypothetical protein
MRSPQSYKPPEPENDFDGSMVLVGFIAVALAGATVGALLTMIIEYFTLACRCST